MRFESKNKKHYLNGELKEVKSFALFPTKVEGKIIWLEKYIKVKELKTVHYREEVAVTSGLLEDAVTFTGLVNERTRIVNREYTGWFTVGKRLIDASE